MELPANSLAAFQEKASCKALGFSLSGEKWHFWLGWHAAMIEALRDTTPLIVPSARFL